MSQQAAACPDPSLAPGRGDRAAYRILGFLYRAARFLIGLAVIFSAFVIVGAEYP